MSYMKIDSVIEKIKSCQRKEGINTRVIAIDGPGGSGKTALAERISKILRSQVIHTDDFFDPIARNNWWKRLISEVLLPINKNKKGKYQRYDWDMKALAEWHEVEPADFLIIEGVQASRKDLRDFSVFHIWVETPRDVRLKRGLERDGENARAEWGIWMSQEDEYIRDEHPEVSADLIIDGTDLELLD